MQPIVTTVAWNSGYCLLCMDCIKPVHSNLYVYIYNDVVYIRLADGRGPFEGRVEVYHNGDMGDSV